jgi:hypothetical protein
LQAKQTRVYTCGDVAFWPKAKNLLSLSALLTLIFGLLGIYYTLRGRRTNLVVDVAAESNVLDVRTSVRDLAVLFQGRDIQQDNANLKILQVRLSNEGEENILENYFDSRIPWGLQIEGGRVIEARITGSNSPYLSENLHPKLVDSNRVILDKVIFDKGKYVGLELLVLHNKNTEPQVTAVGKIAGMDEIRVTNSFKERDQQGLLHSVFNGSVAIQIIRAIAYFIITTVSVIVVAVCIAGLASIPSRFRKRSRRQRARYLAKADSPEKEKKRQVLVEIFVEDGLEELRRTRKLLTDRQRLERTLSVRAVMPVPAPGVTPAEMHRLEMMAMTRGGERLFRLLRADLLRVSTGSVEVDAEVLPLLSGLIAELSESSWPKEDTVEVEDVPGSSG